MSSIESLVRKDIRRQVTETAKQDYALHIITNCIVDTIREPLTKILQSSPENIGRKIYNWTRENNLISLSDYARASGKEDALTILSDLELPVGEMSTYMVSFTEIKVLFFSRDFTTEEEEELDRVPDDSNSVTGQWDPYHNRIVILLDNLYEEIVKENEETPSSYSISYMLLGHLAIGITHELRHALNTYLSHMRGAIPYSRNKPRKPRTDKEKADTDQANYLTQPEEISARYSEAILSILNWVKEKRQESPTYMPSNDELRNMIMQTLERHRVIGDFGLLSDNPQLRSQYQRIISRAYNYVQGVLSPIHGVPETPDTYFDQHLQGLKKHRHAPSWRRAENYDDY